MSQKKVKATKLTVNLPFNIGALELEPDEVQQQAAWELYVELTTRIAVQSLDPDEGFLREALTSLYNIFGITREVLRKAGPSVAKSSDSLGAVAIKVLNQGLRPFLAKWHPLLQTYEENRPPHTSTQEHELNWDRATELRKELRELQEQMLVYTEALALIAGVAINTEE